MNSPSSVRMDSAITFLRDGSHFDVQLLTIQHHSMSTSALSVIALFLCQPVPERRRQRAC
jgi:hypothetical protein